MKKLLTLCAVFFSTAFLHGQSSCASGNPVPVQACTPSGSTPVQLQHQFFAGTTSTTPTGTQFIPIGSRGAILATAATAQQIVATPMTLTSIRVFLTAAEGAAATLAFTLQKCTPSGTTCTASNTAVTCTVGNSANVCSGTGFSVAIAVGDMLDITSVQVGTGTAQLSSIAIAYQ